MNDLKEQTKNKLLDLSLNEKKLLITELSNRLFNDLNNKNYIQLTNVLALFEGISNLNINHLILNALIESNINLNESLSNEKANLWKTKINNLFINEIKQESNELNKEDIEYFKLISYALAMFKTPKEFIDGLKELKSVKNYINLEYSNPVNWDSLDNLINILSEAFEYEEDN